LDVAGPDDDRHLRSIGGEMRLLDRLARREDQGGESLTIGDSPDLRAAARAFRNEELPGAVEA